MTSAASAPISSHPAFAPSVGLWFAALLGLGLFVMPGEVHALLATKTGLAELIPAAAWRGAIAAIGALFGLLFGLVIAQRVARANTEIEPDDWEIATPEDSVWLGEKTAPQPPSEEAAAPAYRLFNPREELDELGIGHRAPPEELNEAGADHDAPPEDDGESALIQAWREEREGFEEIEEAPEPAVDTSKESEFATADEPEELDTAPETDWFADEIENTAEVIPAVEGPPVVESEMPPIDAALGDLPLSALTKRLEQAIEAHRQHEAMMEAAKQVDSEPASRIDDPVIAFLRREADRTGARRDETLTHTDDPQAVLRNALDKLSRVSNPK